MEFDGYIYAGGNTSITFFSVCFYVLLPFLGGSTFYFFASVKRLLKSLFGKIFDFQYVVIFSENFLEKSC